MMEMGGFGGRTEGLRLHCDHVQRGRPLHTRRSIHRASANGFLLLVGSMRLESRHNSLSPFIIVSANGWIPHINSSVFPVLDSRSTQDFIRRTAFNSARARGEFT